MKLPNSKIYWADYLSYSAMLTDTEICEVMKLIAMRAMSYDAEQNNLPDNPQDNLSDNLSDNPPVSIQKQIQIQILKLNPIQIDFYNSLAKAQDESAKDYLSKIENGKKGGRPAKKKKNQTDYQNENQNGNQVENQDAIQVEDKDNTEKETESYDNIYQTSAYNFVKSFGCVGSAYKDEVYIDNDFNLFQLDHPQTKQMIELYGDGLAYDIQKWIRRKFAGKRIGKRFIIEQFAKFYERNQK